MADKRRADMVGYGPRAAPRRSRLIALEAMACGTMWQKGYLACTSSAAPKRLGRYEARTISGVRAVFFEGDASLPSRDTRAEAHALAYVQYTPYCSKAGAGPRPTPHPTRNDQAVVRPTRSLSSPNPIGVHEPPAHPAPPYESLFFLASASPVPAPNLPSP